MAIALMGLAQAAAILIAVGLAWHARHPAPDPPEPPVAQTDTPAPPRVPSAIRVSAPVMFEAGYRGGAPDEDSAWTGPTPGWWT